MSKVGYARVSTVDQSLDVQLQKLRDDGCDKIYSDTASGSDTRRQGLKDLMAYLRAGDNLVVTRVDRIARSVLDLQQLVSDLKASGKAFLDMLAVFAEFELNIRRERQMEGIAAAKVAGKYKGRKPVSLATREKVISLHEQYCSISNIARQSGVSRNTVYKILREG
ncbi:recombinase family protein [Photobacterium damselae]|uniref:recombinase family protein n=1 Tax=Photobacterium damselae TaxID=38293 RepID=UPI0010FD67BC|nr:recombinase family protein [Photobacterium damselae]MCG3826453.1 recombinase family protein [Photobacterium damselae]TLS84000.1 recombinase family protein [Photobacterium damselae subsp. damselae]WIH22038.1 recombinase family protein [Photobacterium damselae]